MITIVFFLGLAFMYWRAFVLIRRAWPHVRRWWCVRFHDHDARPGFQKR